MNWIVVFVSVISLQGQPLEATARDAFMVGPNTRERCLGLAKDMNDRLAELKVYGKAYVCLEIGEKK